MKRLIFILIVVLISISGCRGGGENPPQEEFIPDEKEETSILDISQVIHQYIQEMTPNEKIGQLLMPAFRSYDYQDNVDELSQSMENMLEEYKVGGVILFKENIKTKDQVKKLIEDLQGKSSIPLLIGVDEEGGLVSRISSNPEMGYERIPAAFDIGERNNKDEAYRVGSQLGAMLKELGFNMDFAPAADIWSNPNNKVIGKRSFGNNPLKVSQMSSEVVRGLQEEGVISVVKHFPGHGDTNEDTHLGRALVNRSLDELLERELLPFQENIHKGVAGVMVAHVELPQLDKGVPATLSHKIITGILKQEMAFKGLIITDALDMEAITSQFGKGEAALKSFMAGADILLMPDVKEAYDHLLKAYEDGRITDERLEESVYKILYTKHQYKIID